MSMFEERMQIRSDLISGKIPKRVFISATFTLEAACSYAGIDLTKAHYDMELAEKAYDAVCKDFYSDQLPGMSLRYPLSYQILGAKNWVMGSNGVMQHPEILTMEAEDYDDYIADPYGTMMEKFLPRACPELDTDPVTRSQVLAKAYLAYKKAQDGFIGIMGRLVQKHGRAPGFMKGELIEAPLMPIKPSWAFL